MTVSLRSRVALAAGALLEDKTVDLKPGADDSECRIMSGKM